MKPKARPYDEKSSFLAWVCQGQKNGQFHCKFGESWWEACKQWHETEPMASPPRQPDGPWSEFSDDIPF